MSYEELSKEEFRRKPYFSELKLDDLRKRFKISSFMLESVRANFSNKYRADSLECQYCLQTSKHPSPQGIPSDTQNHILIECPAYSDLRLLYNTDSDLGIVQFYTEVVKRRFEEGEP